MELCPHILLESYKGLF